MRIDRLLVERGFFPSRQKAQAALMAGQVLVDEKVVDKAGTQVKQEADIRIAGNTLAYVSRGGLKLEKAHRIFGVGMENRVVADIGASTGGFTDFCLQQGASRVYAVDVGYGQLDWRLRQDPRVIVLERTNARFLDEKSLEEKTDIVVTDVSFISLAKIFPAIGKILKDGGEVIALIKPQFEAGKDQVGRGGVVRDPGVHFCVIRELIDSAADSGLGVRGLDYSPIRGPRGNIEYLIYLKQGSSSIIDEKIIRETVEKAHADREG